MDKREQPIQTIFSPTQIIIRDKKVKTESKRKVHNLDTRKQEQILIVNKTSPNRTLPDTQITYKEDKDTGEKQKTKEI